MVHFPADMRRPILVFSVALGCFAMAMSCARPAEAPLGTADKQQIAAEIEHAMREAYDLSKPNVAERMLSLYPKTGPIVSAAGGRVVGTKDSLAAGIRYFWNNVGSNMRSPEWIWERFYVDVLSPTTAVVTATYRIPHRDPRNMPHELAGAMTEVFEKRDGRWVIVQEHLSDRPAAERDSTNIPTHDDH